MMPFWLREWVQRLGSIDPASLPPVRRMLLLVLRIVLATARDLTQGPINLWAMSLVYTTLLSLVPLLALSFSVLKAFGAHNVAEPLISQLLAPLGSQSVELTERIIGFVENMQVGVLGSLGLGFLLYTVVSLIQKVERAVNEIWHISDARSLARSFNNYLVVVLLAPVLYLVSTGLFASVMGAEIVRGLSDWQPVGMALSLIAGVAPMVLITAVFTFIYLYLPNTKVRWQAALSGAVVAALAWLLGWQAFSFFVAGSTNYNAIYSSFAILILLLIWLNVIWTILLVGAQVAFYVQYPAATLSRAGGIAEAPLAHQQWALILLHAVARRHHDGQPPADLDTLAASLNVVAAPLRPVIAWLMDKGFLVRSQDDPPRLVLAVAPEHIRLDEVLTALPLPASSPGGPALQVLAQQMAEASHAVLGDRTLADLLSDPAVASQTASPGTADQSNGGHGQ
ncbi:MAG TPA: YhjD/YihY/BrkB family envelope integrity protein [Candidatus Macondimonas sp.]|nr:YhjD/YihY/BrkB family envelope integrity protein [Candidatus Macondimonas sp.]